MDFKVKNSGISWVPEAPEEGTITVQELVKQINIVREKRMESNDKVSVSVVVHTDSLGAVVNVVVHCDQRSHAMYFSVEDVVNGRAPSPFSERVLGIMAGVNMIGQRNVAG